ncbi:hypothetical protein EU803_16350 [Loktanella sp. IMCC34160]|uniref:hypothetical protein n=1 Tax=Loktanella sp. IMCC34160 TaxID=2510646 RepID=UPI00101CEC67|nr:hypothetical protein [Loktanella sp. IMCC34160]RYG89723.1 hypothetical protein EU803_16350 [Loktanella sp. IMCC34160]
MELKFAAVLLWLLHTPVMAEVAFSGDAVFDDSIEASSSSLAAAGVPVPLGKPLPVGISVISNSSLEHLGGFVGTITFDGARTASIFATSDGGGGECKGDLLRESIGEWGYGTVTCTDDTGSVSRHFVEISDRFWGRSLGEAIPDGSLTSGRSIYLRWSQHSPPQFVVFTF